MEAVKIESPDNKNDLISDFLSAIRLRKLLVIVVTLLFLAGGVAVALLSTKYYQAKVVATFAGEAKSSGGLGALVGQFGGIAELAGVQLGGQAGARDANMAYLKSRDFIDQFIVEKKLMPILFEKKWDAQAGTWKVPEDKQPTQWQAYQIFSKQILDVQLDKKTGLITITVTWRDRDQAVDWANDLVLGANRELRRRAIAETEVTINYLENELKKTSVAEVQTTIYKVMEAQVKAMMLANTQEQFAFKVIDPAKTVDKSSFVKPKRLTIVLAAGLLGIFFSSALAFFVESKRRKKVMVISVA